MRDRLFIRTLTGGDLVVEAPAPIRWKGRAARALLALLALQPGKPVSRDVLADLLSKRDQRTARAGLRMALLALRRTLDPVDPNLIRATNESIMLNVEREAVDWVRFEALCTDGDSRSRLEALELYQGDLLAAFPVPALAEAVSEVLRVERERLREIAISTGLGLIAEFEHQNEPNQSGAIARRVLVIDPANERAHRAMMRAYGAAGGRPAVLRQYEQCRKALEDYGLAPSMETVALRDEIIESQAAEPGEPAAQAGISARGDAVAFEKAPSRHPRRHWRGLLLAALALVALTLAGRALLPCGLLSNCPVTPPLAVIVLSPLGFDATDRRMADIAGDITEIILKPLSRIPESIVITPASPGKLPPLPKNSYLVEAFVQRYGDQLHFDVLLHNRGSGERILHDRFKIGVDGLAQISNELEAGLIPELQSNIGRDRPSD
ncbi:MAG: AfsR/SARP family transcriptional regulator [Alphaproteobacteria bacterium]